MLIIILLAGVCYNVYVKAEAKSDVDAIEFSDEEQEEQVDYGAEIDQLLDEMTPFAQEIAEDFIYRGNFGGGCGRAAHINDSLVFRPCVKCFDKLDALRDKMTQKQQEKFDELCNPIIPFIKSYSPESEIAKRIYEIRINAKVDKYPVVFALTSEGDSFEGGYVGYYYYESQGPESKIWLKIETSQYVSDEEYSGLYEYVNNSRIGRFELSHLAGAQNNTDAYYIFYCNKDKRLEVNFESKYEKMEFVDVLEDHGYKPISM